jgi:drug/metabolite transporter (DMT)-like permease
MAFNPKNQSSYYLATLAGISAILLWASNIAFSKGAMEKEGSIQAAFLIYFYSGICISILLLIFNSKVGYISSLKSLSVIYYLRIGIFFIINNVLLFLAIGLVKNSEELVIVTLLNYTWPILIYILGVPVLKLKLPLALFIPGIILSFLGIALALLQGYDFFGFGRVFRAGDDNIPAYILAFLTAVSWALYSNFTVRFKSGNDLAAIPFIFILSSLVFLGILFFTGQISRLHLSAIFHNHDLQYMVAGPTSLGYLGWYFAMKKGNKMLVTALSFFIPMLSLIMLRIKFHMEIRIMFWIAVILLISGSYMCYRAFRSDRNIA